MPLILVQVDTKEMSQPSSTQYLEQVRNAIVKPLEETLGKKTTIVVTNLKLQILTKEDLGNFVFELRKIYEEMKD